ncbi:MAG: YceI family protein [Acidobacteriota bacterium]
MKRTLSLVLAALLVSLAGPALAADYTIDAGHTSALFKVKHLDTAYFYGMFKDVKGTVSYDASNPSAASIDVTIAAESVDTRSANRDDHVKSPDFLNAKQFPTISFKSKSVKANGDGLAVTGDLTLHGVTQEITVQAEVTGQGKHPRSGKDIIGFHAAFSVDRTAHDMEFMVGPLSSDIEFVLSIEAAGN